MEFYSLFNILKKQAKNTNIKYYMIGGAVRDMLLKRENITDIDISVEYNFDGFIEMLKEIINIKTITFFPLKTASIKLNGINIDIVTARKEKYPANGVLPMVIPSNINDDIKRRDFTINSIGYDFQNNEYIDPLNGISDLKKGIIRGNRKNLFIEDPTRIFRLIRYQNRFSMEMDKKTECDLMRSLKNRELFETVSKSRIHKEWEMILAEDNVIKCLMQMKKIKLFDNILKKKISIYPNNFTKSFNNISNILAIFYHNDTIDVINIADILNNGNKKSIIKDIEHILSYIQNGIIIPSNTKKKYTELMKRIQK